MAKERNGFIVMRPEDFVTVKGSPYYPARLVGEEGNHLVPSQYRCVVIDGQPWVTYDDLLGPLSTIKKRVDELNRGKGIPEELMGAKFAAGLSYYWNSGKQAMVTMTDRYFKYRVWINRLPENDPNNIVTVQEVSF